MFDPEDAMAKVMRFNPPPPFLSFHTHTQTHLPPATPHAPPLCPPAMQPAMSENITTILVGIYGDSMEASPAIYTL